MVLVGALSLYLFYRGHSLSAKEYESMQNVQQLSSCSDANTQFSNPDVLNSLARGVQVSFYGEVLTGAMTAFGLLSIFGFGMLIATKSLAKKDYIT